MRALLAENVRPLFANHVFFSLGASLPVGALQQLIAGIEQSDKALTLLGGLGEVESVRPAARLWGLSRQIRRSTELSTAFDGGVSALQGRLESGGDDAHRFMSSFAEFLYDHGSRGINKWELRAPTWETNPELALAALDRMRLAGDEADPIAQGATMSGKRRSATALVAAVLGDESGSRSQFESVLRASCVMIQARERCKTTIVRVIHEARMCMYELGRRMATTGWFEDANDFGSLTDAELDAFLEDPSAWQPTLRSRRPLFDQFAALREPFVFQGRPPPPDRWPRRDQGRVAPAEEDTTLSGLPGCPGEAVGHARVVLDLFDPTRLLPGDVLIAPSVDASWTPLFVPACAVVVDVGATMSHTVIVSRELGIPCVVSVTDATKKIADGALVRVDGLRGTVTILSSS